MALMGAFGSLVSMVVSSLVRNPAGPPVPGLRAVTLLVTAILLCFFLFCLWTVVALFRMRPWARYSILVIGGLEFGFSLLLCAVMILIRKVGPPIPPSAAPPPIAYQTLFLGIAAFYGCLSLIGLWWLIYFNLPSVRAAFTATSLPSGGRSAEIISGEASAREPVAGWRLVIVVWACLMLAGVLFFPLMLFMHMPLFLFGFVFRGGQATGILLVLVALQLYLGIGLLQKWKPAWFVGLGWQLYTVAIFAAFFVPGVWSRFAAYQQEMMTRWVYPTMTVGNTALPIANAEIYMRPGMILGAVGGVAMVLLFTIALLRRQSDYLRTEPASSRWR
jgi:hypothetical protein